MRAVQSDTVNFQCQVFLTVTGFGQHRLSNNDPYVANKEIKGSNMTVRFHVDDCMSSHKLAGVNDNFF